MKFQWWHGALIVAFVLALLSPLASSSPDGLERVAEDTGFMSAAREAFYELIPDYVVPGVSNQALATVVAGIIGTAFLFGIGYGIAKLLKARGGA
jgi:hypothetical protein